MKSALDKMFEQIHLFKDLEEVEDFISQELSRQHINAVAQYREEQGVYSAEMDVIDDEDYLDADDWIYSAAFKRTLLEDPRCPRWLERDIIWRLLGGNKYH